MSFDNNDWKDLADDARKLQMLKNSNAQRDSLNKLANGSRPAPDFKQIQANNVRFFKIYLKVSVVVLALLAAWMFFANLNSSSQ